jgi:8-oxo-dGTP pyrophosphatase MutT (NUDIX family)
VRIRAGCILIEDGRLALIERHRGELHYFTFPGGGVDEGEAHEATAIREMLEETGLQVKIIRKIADVYFNGNLQPFFLVEKIGGEYGTGTGEEFGEYDPVHGSYHPVWMPLTEILSNNVVPRPLAEIVSRSPTEGWPGEPVVILEETK